MRVVVLVDHVIREIPDLGVVLALWRRQQGLSKLEIMTARSPMIPGRVTDLTNIYHCRHREPLPLIVRCDTSHLLHFTEFSDEFFARATDTAVPPSDRDLRASAAWRSPSRGDVQHLDDIAKIILPQRHTDDAARVALMRNQHDIEDGGRLFMLQQRRYAVETNALDIVYLSKSFLKLRERQSSGEAVNGRRSWRKLLDRVDLRYQISCGSSREATATATCASSVVVEVEAPQLQGRRRSTSVIIVAGLSSSSKHPCHRRRVVVVVEARLSSSSSKHVCHRRRRAVVEGQLRTASELIDLRKQIDGKLYNLKKEVSAQDSKAPSTGQHFPRNDGDDIFGRKSGEEV
ncbi:hypothetical protein ACS0TY_009596 [Phlomoides rotata]